MIMKFEWDEIKNRENIAKHGFDFADAHQVFDNPVVERLDNRFVYNEERWIAVGVLRDVVCVVLVYTERPHQTFRIISFRKADRNEREAYYKALPN